MKAAKKLCSALAACALFLSSIPAAGATYTGGPRAVSAATARCNRLAGREKVRCQSTHNRGERLQLKKSRIEARERRTSRERREVFENFSENTIEGREGAMTAAKRRHVLGGGNTRRQLQEGFADARNQCKYKDRSERAACRRSFLRGAQRTDYRNVKTSQ